MRCAWFRAGLLVVVLVALLAVGAASVAADTYNDSSGRFSFTTPDGWQVDPSPSSDLVVQYSSSSPLGIFNVAAVDLPGGFTLDVVVPLQLAALQKQLDDFQLVGTTTTTLAGETATQADYTATIQGTKITFSQIYVAHNETEYILTLGAQPDDFDTFKTQASDVINSWAWQ